MKRKIFICGLVMFFPFFSFAASSDIVINEISWSGTKFSSSDEWIELKNNTAQEIDLAGFGIYEKGGSELIVSLSGKIAANDYYLIERTDDSAVSDIAADLVAPFGGNGLGNSGEHLILKDSSGNIIDELNFSAGWPAGIAAPDYNSMEKDLAGWHSNEGKTRNGIDAGGNFINGTPRLQNSIINATSSSQASDSENAATSTDSALVSSSAFPAAIQPSIRAEAGNNIITVVGEEVIFDGSASQGVGLKFSWNFGDGSVENGNPRTQRAEQSSYDGKSAKHIYQFPGTYIAVLSAVNDSASVNDQVEVTVYPGGISISEFLPLPDDSAEQWVEIYNYSNTAADLSGWEIDAGVKNKFKLPEHTFISAGGFLVLPANAMKIQISREGALALHYPNGYAASKIEFSGAAEGLAAAQKPDGSFFWTKSPTPGGENIFIAGTGGLSVANERNNIAVVSNKTASGEQAGNKIKTVLAIVGENKNSVSYFLPTPVLASVSNDIGVGQQIGEQGSIDNRAFAFGAFSWYTVAALLGFISIISVSIYVRRKRL